MLDWTTCPAVDATPRAQRRLGIPRHAGACERPVRELEGGATVERSWAWFPGVAARRWTRWLEHARAASRRPDTTACGSCSIRGARPAEDHLRGHQVQTAFELGWSTLRNGELKKLRVGQGMGVRQRARYARANGRTVRDNRQHGSASLTR